MIDTHVPGSPASVRSVAEWLSPSLKNGVDDFGDFCHGHRVGHSGWLGESGEAYLALVDKLLRAADEQSGPASDAAEKLRAYAGQLERMQSDFADLCDEARDGGLLVVSTFIHPPRQVAERMVCSSDEAEQAVADEFQQRVDLYDRLSREVGERWGELEAWVAENLDAFENGVTTDVPMITTILGSMAATNKIAFDAVVELKSQHFSETLDGLRSEAAHLRADAVRFRDALRSGNPAIRAAALEADPDGLRRSANALEDAADGLRRSPIRHLPLLGDAVSVGLAGQEIASGASPSSVIVEEVGGIVGGVAAGAAVVGGAALLGVTAPVWGTAAAVVAGGFAIGAGATWAYEEWVPQDVRESIDAGLEDAWDATTEFASDTWDDVTEGVSDAWNAVFG